MSQTKFVVIPTYGPIYSAKKVFGPEWAPLTKPTPFPIPIIGEMLLQSGKEKLDVYEVVKQGKNWSDPVKLTLENYKLPYEEIVGVEESSVPTGTVSGSEPTPPAPVNPTIVPNKKPEETVPENFTDILRGQVDPFAELSKVDPGDLKIQTEAELVKKVEEEVDVVEGHLDPEQFGDMSDENLGKLATDMGVENTETKTRAELVQEISEIPVQVSAEDEVPVEPEAVKPEEQVERAENNNVEEIGDKRTMTKSERKRAAREAREREAALAAQQQNNIQNN